LYGDNESEAAEIDQVCECLVDLGLAMRNYFHEKDVARKENILKELLETEATKHFKFLLNLLEANDGGNGFYVGNRITIADILFFNRRHYSWLYSGHVTLTKAKELVDKIGELPA
ncbi:putative S-crystallin SL11, partial [Apostichopus japonicus]